MESVGLFGSLDSNILLVICRSLFEFLERGVVVLDPQLRAGLF